MPDHHLLLLADAVAVSLVDWLKPVLMLASFLPYAWVASSRIEADARYFHFDYHLWNGVFIAGAAAAAACMLLIPIFWIGWPLGLLVLATPLLVYWKFRNDRVPEDKKFHLTGKAFADVLATRKAARSQKQASIVFVDAKKQALPIPNADDPLHQVHLAAEQILEPALNGRAARVEVAPIQGGAAVLQTLDGVRYKREPIPAETANRIIDYLKSIAKLDTDDRRRRQVGKFRLRWLGGDVNMDIAVAGSSSGQTMRLDFERSKRIQKPFDSLGLLPSQQAALKTLDELGERHGVVLVGAPAGHGLTTLGYSLIGRHDAFTANIKTLEREVELELDGVDHVRFDPSNTASDYATSLQSILRRDPDIVLVSDIREPNAAKTAAGAGMNGPLVYVEMVSDSVPAMFNEWTKAVGDVKTASKGLRAIVNERLVRNVCPNCRQAFQPSPEQAKKLGMTAGKGQLYRASGKVQVKNRIEDCPVCAGIGYLGQTGVFEVMPVDDEARRMLSAGDFKGAYAHARRNRMIYLQEAGLTKVRDGVTTIEEIARVLGGKSETATAPAAAASSASG
ncbi:MAG: Flp pilus assembly complex ATPase component TadA [Phycisphaerales bacterium]|nr:Flp pilus assembly complex ATPase component TadA [Phycisphaerales bacterium]